MGIGKGKSNDMPLERKTAALQSKSKGQNDTLQNHGKRIDGVEQQKVGSKVKRMKLLSAAAPKSAEFADGTSGACESTQVTCEIANHNGGEKLLSSCDSASTFPIASDSLKAKQKESTSTTSPIIQTEINNQNRQNCPRKVLLTFV